MENGQVTSLSIFRCLFYLDKIFLKKIHRVLCACGLLGKALVYLSAFIGFPEAFAEGT
jgi:hypothetical protein